MNLTVYTFTTPDKENFTEEFQWTEEQLRRAAALQGSWEAKKVQINADCETSVWRLISEISARLRTPLHDREGGSIGYKVQKLSGDHPLKSGIVQTRPVMAWWLNSLGERLDENMTLAEQGIKDEDELIFCPGVHAGGPDPLTVAASIAQIAQLILMVADMWIKRKSSASRRAHEEKTASSIDKIQEIRICMEDGNWMHLDENRCSYAAQLVSDFSRPGASVKPRYAIVVLGREKVRLQLSTDIDQQNFAEFIESIQRGVGNEASNLVLKRAADAARLGP